MAYFHFGNGLSCHPRAKPLWANCRVVYILYYKSVENVHTLIMFIICSTYDAYEINEGKYGLCRLHIVAVILCIFGIFGCLLKCFKYSFRLTASESFDEEYMCQVPRSSIFRKNISKIARTKLQHIFDFLNV